MTEECVELVLCAGRRHRILWHLDTPTLLDHPDIDFAAEAVLAVLSGGIGCVERAVAWQRVGVCNIARYAGYALDPRRYLPDAPIGAVAR